MFTSVMITSTLLLSQLFEPLPLEEILDLNPQVMIDETISEMVEASDLVFTLDSITRHISILGWASERYDLDVGEILKGDLEEEVVNLYVFPEALHSEHLSFLLEGSSVIIFAVSDSTHSHMEGFRTSEGDWAVVQIQIW